MKFKYTRTTLICVLSALSIGCGASKQQAMLETIGSPQTGAATFESLSEDLQTAEQNGVNLISPARYQSATSYFKLAQEQQAQGRPESKVSESLREARSNLDAATTFANANREQLMPLLTAREAAINTRVEGVSNSDLKSLEERYLILVRDLDRRDSQRGAQSRIPDLTKDYQKLSIRNLQASYLSRATNNLALAKNGGAKELSPKALQETEEAIKEANDLIVLDQSANSIPQIAEKCEVAVASSERLLNIMRQAKGLKALTPEEMALKMEATSTAAAKGSANLQKQVTDLRKKTEKLSVLEKADIRTKKFESVRQLFNEDEARVSQEGGSLIISLKKINFPVSKSDIPSSSFELLKKVQTAIKTFDEPSVVVEGHTDSTGTAALNKALSEERAEAVKGYLLSNSVVNLEKVEAIGYGSEKPLASNKSSAGRATNRRIDIVIKD